MLLNRDCTVLHINQVAYKWFIFRISQTYNKIDGNSVICQILHKMVKKEVSEILKIIICNCSLNFFKHKQIPKTSETRVKSPRLYVKSRKFNFRAYI